ncbi:nucleoside triphosphate pyrophosphohydrolase [Halobacillus sp. BAB-2008]|uniref:nucleoside triphosphate pyrophosphohydrolase n=1 Tax=Halobacillus sp. BAB-2008 TaxID=1246484 RepID=UPI0002A4EAB0|nr:nucleoside triphosphate pyrophosphohydrolase [Halobacillus sp. BAB-2008]ELK46527.1 hypothetical protein D479_10351 [Halobacillus sp. BAB-2008]
MVKHQRLVRYYVPNQLESEGKSFRTRTLETEEYEHLLRNRLKEEVDAYHQTEENRHALTALADILEVVHALSYTHGASIEELEHIRQHRRKVMGGFLTKTLLIDAGE